MSKNNEVRKVRIIAEGKQAEASIKQMRAASALLNNELAKLPRNSQAFANKAKEFKHIQAQLRATTMEIRGLKQASKSFWTDIKKVGLGVVAGGLITGLTQQIRQLGGAMAMGRMKIEEGMADVRKVTGLTTEQVETLRSRLGNIDTRSARSELMELAWVAGKLGIQGVENIFEFVKAADQINIALGKDLGADSVKHIGKLANIFKLDEMYGIEKGMLKIASAINETGMASSASEGYLVNFSRRLAGLSGTAGLTAPDIIALGGTLDSLAQPAETASTAISKLFIRMGKDVTTYAKFANLEVAEFSKLLKEDAMAAFKLVLEGSSKTANGMEALTETLGELGLDGGRVVNIFGALATNMPELTRQQEVANNAFKEGVSVTNEFALKNETLMAKWEKFTKAYNAFFLNSRVAKLLGSYMEKLSDMVTITENNVEAVRKSHVEYSRLVFALKDTELSTETRKRLIKTLNSEYGKYLPSLIKEKDTMKEIEEKTKAGNEALLQKIMIVSMEEKIKEYTQKSIELTERLVELEFDKNLAIQKMQEEHIGTMGEVNETEKKYWLERKNRAEQEIDNTKKQITEALDDAEKFRKKFHEIARELGFDFNNEDSGFEEFITDSVKGQSEISQKIRDLHTELIDDKREKEIVALGNKLEDEINAIKEMKASETEKAEAIKLLKEKHLVDLAEINEKHDEADYKSKLEILKELELAQKASVHKLRAEGVITKEEESKRVLNIEKEVLKEKKRLALELGKSVAEIEAELAKIEIKLSKDTQEKKKLDKITELEYRAALERENSLKRLEFEKEILDLARDQEIASLHLTEEQKALIEDFYRKEKLRKEKELWSEMSNLSSSYLRELGSIYGSHIRILNNKDQGRINEMQAARDEELKRLETRHNRELISEEQLERQKARIEEEYREKEAKIKEEQFLRQRKADIIQAIVNTSVAVTNALRTDPTGVLSLLVGAAGAFQVAAIRSQPVPQFFDGGSTGKVKGKQDNKTYAAQNIGSFASGGNVSSPSVGLIGEQGPELVIPNWLYTAPQSADLMGALESAIASKSIGGFASANNNIQNQSSESFSKLEKKFDVIISLINKTNEIVSKPTRAKVHWNQTDFNLHQLIEEDSKKRSML